MLLCFLKLFLLKHKKKLSCGCDLTSECFPRSLQGVHPLDELWRCPGHSAPPGPAGNAEHTFLQRIQVHVLLLPCLLSCERGDLAMKSFTLHWWKCPTGAHEQINAEPGIVYIPQHKSFYNQSNFIWLDRRLRKFPIVKLDFKLSAFQYLWNSGNIKLLPWVCTFSLSFMLYYLFSCLTLLYFFSAARLRYFNLSCMPLILHMLLPWFLISFVLTLVLHSSNCGVLCKYS